MNRYSITQDNTTLHLYYPTIGAAKQAYPNAIVELYEDNSFVNCIEKIMALAENASAKWWKIPYGCGYIAYRQFKDEDGWLDGCEYIRYDHHSYTMPFMKTVTDPKSFYERFLAGIDEGEHGFKRFSKRQFDKLKGKARPIKFATIDGTSWYVDGYGNFFEHQNGDTGKKSMEEWKQFHDNPNAVLGRIWSGVHGWDEIKWYDSMDDFKVDFKAKVETTPTWAITPRYEIVKVGYTKKHPYDRENYIRLPYYPVDKVLKAERNVDKVVLSWAECAKGIKYYRYGMGDMETVVKKYWEWVDKNEL